MVWSAGVTLARSGADRVRRDYVKDYARLFAAMHAEVKLTVKKGLSLIACCAERQTQRRRRPRPR